LTSLLKIIVGSTWLFIACYLLIAAFIIAGFHSFEFLFSEAAALAIFGLSATTYLAESH